MAFFRLVFSGLICHMKINETERAAGLRTRRHSPFSDLGTEK